MFKPVSRTSTWNTKLLSWLLFERKGGLRSGLERMFSTFIKQHLEWSQKYAMNSPAYLWIALLFSLKIAAWDKCGEVRETHENSLFSLCVFSFCTWRLPHTLAYMYFRILIHLALPSQRKIRHHSESTKNLWTNNSFDSNFSDPYKILEKQPPTPSLKQHFAFSDKLVLRLG